jgi:hypothetical protein
MASHYGPAEAAYASESIGTGSADGVTALIPASGMLPPITILTAGASSAREPISRSSFASNSRTCSAPFFVRMTSPRGVEYLFTDR